MSGMDDYIARKRRELAAERAEEEVQEALRRESRAREQVPKDAVRESLKVLARILSAKGIPTDDEKGAYVPDKWYHNWLPRSTPHFPTIDSGGWKITKMVTSSRSYEVVNESTLWFYLMPDGTVRQAGMDQKWHSTDLSDHDLAQAVVDTLVAHNLTWPGDAPDLTQHFDLS